MRSKMDTQTFTGLAGAGDLEISAVVKVDTETLGATYGLSPEQATFFKAQTGINNDADLKTHILEVQENAYKVSDAISFRVYPRRRTHLACRYFPTYVLGGSRSSSMFLPSALPYVKC